METAQETLVAQWRDTADSNNPAGPLFAGGEFAEADIVGDGGDFITILCTGACGSVCTNNCVCC